MSYVSISGNIGTGKSTLLDALWEDGYNVTPEDTGPEFLEHLDHYNQDPTYAIHLQNYINNYRFYDAIHSTRSKYHYVHERCMADDIVFTTVMYGRGEIERDAAMQFITCAGNRLWEYPPEKIIYLYCEPEVGYERMRSRGRPEESQQTLNNIAELEEAHMRVLPVIAEDIGIEFVEVDWTHYGSVEDIARLL